MFDVIVLHGIWSWISDENRRAIVKIARQLGNRRYFLHFLQFHAGLVGGHATAPPHEPPCGPCLGRGQGVVSKIDGALAFAKTVVDLKPAISRRIRQWWTA